MSTPLDLEAIRAGIKLRANYATPDVNDDEVLALISEVEALRNEVNDKRSQRDALRAKLEKAKEALVSLRNAETNGSIRYNGETRCKIIREALAELEDKKEPQT